MPSKGRHQLLDTKGRLAEGLTRSPVSRLPRGQGIQELDREKRQGLTLLFFKGHLRSSKCKQYLLPTSTHVQGPCVKS